MLRRCNARVLLLALGTALTCTIGAARVTHAATRAAVREVRTVRIASKLLGESRTLHVSLPANYKLARQRYPVVIVLDGHVRAFFDLTVAAAGYDLLGDLHDYAIPPQIVIGVEHPDRRVDLGRNGELFTRFLVEELLPWADREYRTVPFRTLIGHSAGGRLALQLFCRAPDAFPAIVAASPSLPDSTMREVQGCMQRTFAAPGSRVQQLVLSAGEKEPRSLETAQQLLAFVRSNAPARWRVRFVDGPGLRHIETPFATIPPAMRFVFDASVWEMPTAQADSVLNRLGDPEKLLAEHLVALSARVGYVPAPTVKWLEVVVGTLLARAEPAAAVISARRLVELYPEHLGGYSLLANAHARNGDPESARKTLTDALQQLDRLEIFDQGERELRRGLLRTSLESVRR